MFPYSPPPNPPRASGYLSWWTPGFPALEHSEREFRAVAPGPRNLLAWHAGKASPASPHVWDQRGPHPKRCQWKWERSAAAPALADQAFPSPALLLLG